MPIKFTASDLNVIYDNSKELGYDNTLEPIMTLLNDAANQGVKTITLDANLSSLITAPIVTYLENKGGFTVVNNQNIYTISF